MLIESGADPTAHTNRSQETAFHMAAKNGYTDILRLLVSALKSTDEESPLYAVDERGHTLLHAATNSYLVAQVYYEISRILGRRLTSTA